MSMRTIVAGVDGSPGSHAALRVAIQEAAAHGSCRVTVIACWSADAHHLARRPDHDGRDSYLTAQAIAREAVEAALPTDHQRSLIVTESGEGDPGPALVRASRTALFLVIGSTSRGAAARHLGKTTVDHCLRHSDVPVIVVPFVAEDIEPVDAQSS